jgi:hypothetical protein
MFGQLSDGIVVNLAVFEGSLSLFSLGNNSPWHWLHLLHQESVTHVFRTCVTFVFRIFVTYVLEWFNKTSQ